MNTDLNAWSTTYSAQYALNICSIQVRDPFGNSGYAVPAHDNTESIVELGRVLARLALILQGEPVATLHQLLRVRALPYGEIIGQLLILLNLFTWRNCDLLRCRIVKRWY